MDVETVLDGQCWLIKKDLEQFRSISGSPHGP
jgi:hypothetical protein